MNQAIELNINEYSTLPNPQFISQTSIDDDGRYWVVFKSNNVLYKFHLEL